MITIEFIPDDEFLKGVEERQKAEIEYLDKKYLGPDEWVKYEKDDR